MASFSAWPGSASFPHLHFSCHTRHRLTGCEWATHANKFSGGYAGGHSTTYSAISDAKAKCIELGVNVCKAITCAGTRCTVRASASLGYSPTGETSYVPNAACYSPGENVPRHLGCAPCGILACSHPSSIGVGGFPPSIRPCPPLLPPCRRCPFTVFMGPISRPRHRLYRLHRRQCRRCTPDHSSSSNLRR